MMKIRKRTIIWFIAAAFLCYCTVSSFTAKEEKSDLSEWKDAIFVEDAKVIPENEGKLIVISGIPEIIEGAVFIRWNIWEPKEEDGFTMVGVQKGNTLTYTELGDTLLPVEQKIMDEKTY